MGKKILRFLLIVIPITLIASIIVLISGLILKWETPAQFSDGFFIAGGILIVIGLTNLMGAHKLEGTAGFPYARVDQFDRDEGFKLWTADLARGYNLFAFLGASGVLLFGLTEVAILIGG